MRKEINEWGGDWLEGHHRLPKREDQQESSCGGERSSTERTGRGKSVRIVADRAWESRGDQSEELKRGLDGGRLDCDEHGEG